MVGSGAQGRCGQGGEGELIRKGRAGSLYRNPTIVRQVIFQYLG